MNAMNMPRNGAARSESRGPFNFWLGVEAFSPQGIPDCSRSRGDVPLVSDYGADTPLPWAPESGLPQARRGHVWQHIVFLGVFDLDSAWDVLEPAAGEDFDGRPAPRSAAAMLTVDREGTLNPDSAVLSQCVWAAGRYRRHRRLDDVFTNFADDETRWSEDLADLARTRGIRTGADSSGGSSTHPVSWDDLESILGLSLKSTGAAGLLTYKGEPVSVIRIRSEQISEKKRAQEAEPGFLNSLFSDDLRRLSQRPATRGPLDQYLGVHRAQRKIDVRKDLNTVYESVAPDLVPDGRWPSNPEHPLALSQQFAVNRALADLEDHEGIFSVNGPPGTGKTTMLRDMIAALVTRRAAALAAFTDPAGAFVDQHRMRSTTQYARTVHELHPSLRGFEMVIASSNNGAVENISLEIPWKNKDVIDQTFHESDDFYFARIATELLNGGERKSQDDSEPRKQAWGLVSAKLGNSKNRAAFVSTALYGDREAREGRDAVPGLIQLLENSPAVGVSGWADARKSFLAAKSRVDRLRAERQKWHQGFRDLPALQAEITELEAILISDSQELAAQEDLITAQAQELAELQHFESTRRAELEAHVAARPRLLEVLRSSGDVTAQWRARYERLTAETDHIRRSIAGLTIILANARKAADDLRARHEQTATKLSHRRSQYRSHGSDQEFQDSPVADWFDPESSAREKRSPWLDVTFNRARSELFMEALKLHEAFIHDQRAAMRQNLLAVQDVLKNDVPADASPETVRHAWEALFMVVPTVTTTFASVPRLFSSLKDERLGWLFVDEAGQAAPQHALCGIARTHRALLVGDPLQLTPVVTLPEKYQTRLLEITGTGSEWLPAHNPAQVLADRNTRYGTIIQPPGGDPLWVGAPLRVHRRCDNPMFDVVNGEVYGGLMIHGEEVPRQPFPGKNVQAPESAWFDVHTSQWNGHASPQELDRLDDLLGALQQAGYKMSDILIVSPFRDTADRIVKVAANYPIDTTARSGTVHRAQGKEASIVIVVLGGRAGGARSWAVSTPNLFNVAVSRAKRRLFVIGDHRHWAELPYFKALDHRLQRHGQDASLADLFPSVDEPASEPTGPEPGDDPALHQPQTAGTVNHGQEPIDGPVEVFPLDTYEEGHMQDRRGLEWDLPAYEALITGIRHGYSDEELALHLGRSVGAVRSRARWLLPTDADCKGPKTALVKLREAVLNGPYDWLAHVRAAHAREETFLWTPDSDRAIFDAWAKGTPSLPELSDALHVSETSIAGRLVKRRHANSTADVVDRLGCTAGSALDVRARIARDKQSMALWVFVVADDQGMIQHLSLHPHKDAALEEKESTDLGQEGWAWTIAQRVVGEGSIRLLTTGIF